MTIYSNDETPSSCGCARSRQPGVLQLPVAPRINHRIRFSPMTPGRESHILPHDAALTLDQVSARGDVAENILIYGPGDPLASIEATLETISLIRDRLPDSEITLRTLGIGGLKHADKLFQAGVTQAEVLVDAIEPEVMEKLFAWVRPGFKTMKLNEAVTILAQEQQQAIPAFKDAGMAVRVITTLYPENNEDHIEYIASRVAELGAECMILQPYTPAKDADIALPTPEAALLESTCTLISKYLPVTLAAPIAASCQPSSGSLAGMPAPSQERPNVAVVSSDGMDVDLHLGQAVQLLIYGPREDGLACLLESRPAPEPGKGSTRWESMAADLSDCFALLAASAGDKPRQVLSQHGITVLLTEDNIEGTVDVLYGGGKKKKCR